MSILGFMKGQWRRAAGGHLERRLARQPLAEPLGPADWPNSLSEPTDFYLNCVRHFHQHLPRPLKEHRAYFNNQGANLRGFGENAFHSMWYLLLQQFKPANFLEIGVFRGQVISLVALWARLAGNPCEVWGISPFSAAGDSVSSYRQNLDYHRDTLQNFDHFGLNPPNLLRARSTDSEAVQLIASRSWDMIYIDGNHDYDIARRDWETSSRNLKPAGIIVLDDAGLATSYQPPVFASRGHPGPSRVAQEIPPSRFREILQVGHNRVFQRVA